MPKVPDRQGSEQEESESKANQPAATMSRLRRPTARTDTPHTSQYDFSDLKDADPGIVAYKYVDIGWRLVPVDRLTGDLVLGVGGPTRDLSTISDWLDNPDITIGIATGQGSRLVALRITGKQGQRTLRTLLAGRATFATLEGRDSRSAYLFFRAPAEKIQSKKEVAPGIDYLGERAHLVLSDSFWVPGCTELAPLPERLFTLVSGTVPFGIADEVATGNFTALNRATAYEAAQEYSRRGWKLTPLDDEGRSVSPGEFCQPELWEKEPELGLGVAMGVDSGVVGLWIADGTRLDALEREFGPLPLPKVRRGGSTIHFFRAPAERFSSKALFADIRYVGEGASLPVPPSVVRGGKFQWEESPEFSPDLPKLPQWLHGLLSAPEAALPVPTPQQQGKNQASQRKALQPQQTVAAALNYASRGWLVFPLQPGKKLPLMKRWQEKATRDHRTISGWWQRKRSNIAIVTGADSGIVVLDVDVKNGQAGLRSLTELETLHGRLETLRAHTPTGGLHLFFRYPDREIRNRTGLRPGLDFRGDGGYVVAAPSTVGGQEYRWEDPAVPVAELPGWLLTLLTEKRSKSGKGIAAASQDLTVGEALAGVQEGVRNDTIFRLAWKLRLEGWEYDQVLVLVKTAAGNCQPPLPEDEALRCLDNAWRYTPAAVLSDMGNAERFVAYYGDSVRYVLEQDRWLVWTGHSWKTNHRAVYRLAKSTIRSLRDEAAAEDDPSRKRLLFAHCRKSESESGLNRMLELTALELAVGAEDLDRPGLVAFANGVYDRAVGTFRPGRREDLLTKHAPIAYDPASQECLQWIEQGASRSGGRRAVRAQARHREDGLLDLLDEWLAERCDVGPGFSARAMPLVKDFADWSGREISPQKFGRLLLQRDFARSRSNGSRYEKLRLRP